MAKGQNVVLSSVATKYDPNHEYPVKVAETYVDWKWNSRIDIASTAPDSETDEAGFNELVVSMAKDGQRTACVVRPNPYKGKAGHPGAKYEYMLVEGFQRTRAICDLAAGEHGILLGKNGVLQTEADALKTKEPVIRAKVIAMTEAEARKRNLAENTMRAQLTAPDIAYGIAELAKTDPTITNVSIGAMLGRDEGYIAKLRRIYTTFKDVPVPADQLWKGSPAMTVVDAWRCAPTKALNVDMLAICDADKEKPLTPEQKLRGYLIAAKVLKDPNAKEKKVVGGNAWKENAPKDARAFGFLLGTLERMGALTVDGITADHWDIVASKYASKASKATEDNKEAIAYACNQGIDEGRKVPKVDKAPKATKEEVAAAKATLDAPGKERAAAKAGAKGKGGKAKSNGKGAHA